MRNNKTIVAVILTALLAAGCSPAAQPAATDYELAFLEVGKADAAVLTSSGSTVVIDAGLKDSAPAITAYLDGRGVSRIDYLFLSHFDKDHIGAASALISGYEVGCVVMPSYQEDSDDYKALMAALTAARTDVRRMVADQDFSCDGITYQVHVSPKDDYLEDADNNRSLIIRIVSGTTAVLMTGDIQQERIALVAGRSWLKADVLKVPHHGRDDAGLDVLLADVDPAVAVIDCKSTSSVDAGVVTLLKDRGITTYMTCDGTVTCLCKDGRLTVGR